MTKRNTLTICGELVIPEALATAIGERYDTWKMARATKERSMQEVRNYVFATDTTTTTNSQLPWKNKTTRPKLCQIRDNLHANYMAALFPNEDWFEWQAGNEDAADVEKAKIITLYMKQKLKECDFEEHVSNAVLDLIDSGVVFGEAHYINDVVKDDKGNIVSGASGPYATRISPYDIVFDITAPSFKAAPKIVRKLVSIGDITAYKDSDTYWKTDVGTQVLNKLKDARRKVGEHGQTNIKKSDGLVADGFGSIYHYYTSGLVEVLEFEGNLYIAQEDKVYSNRKIIIVDRAYVLHDAPINTLTGDSTKHFCGWRNRPDNLWAMGPLDNLVGMQYRIDHLENLKADVFDLIAFPLFKIKGYVEDFEYKPLERIYMEADSDVDVIRPDTVALNADMQIQELEQQMEEMAGAPKQAMGIRTPGEKTKFEVQTLDNAAGRMFQNKITYFEKNYLEKLLNSMLELCKKEMSALETVKYINEFGAESFKEVSPDDLKIKGKLVPMGARHFAAQAQLIQNLTALAGTGLYQDQAVAVHMSGYRIAQLLQDNMNLGKYGIVQKDIRIIEQADTQKLMTTAQDQIDADATTPALTSDDIPMEEEQQNV